MMHIKAFTSKVAAPNILTPASAYRWDIFPYCIGVLFLLTIIAVFHVWSRCQVIDLSLKIADMRHQLKDVQQEQLRLRLEGASLKTPARIETLARGELGMALPTDQQVVMVK